MISDLDEVLRELLVRDLPITNNEIDISFEQPKREWSSRLSRPSLNLYMHDIRENNKLRTQQPNMNVTINGNSATLSRQAIRVDVHYMITAWTNDPGDEHRLLMRTLMVMLRYRELPEELFFGQLDDQEMGIPYKISQYDTQISPRELWSVLDNEMRPSLDLILTLAVNPYEDLTVPLVRETEMGFGQWADSPADGLDADAGRSQYFSVSGTISSDDEFDHLGVQILEISVPVTVSPNGRYTIRNLREGDYTLEVWTGNREPSQHAITVPSPQMAYDIHL